MIGTKKLSAIRKQIEEALASSGADPIQRLEKLITTAKRKGERTTVMEGLQCFLESPQNRKRRQDRVRPKKQSALAHHKTETGGE
jgi:hypothetical protein